MVNKKSPFTERRKSSPVRFGNVVVGGNAPIVVESMTKTDTADVRATVRQVHALERSGCELVRVAVPDSRAALSLGRIVSRSRIPIVADIHFDYRLALAALEEGVAGIRLNPGNIRDRKRIEEVVRSARSKGVPIRIGVNAGSLQRDPAGQRALADQRGPAGQRDLASRHADVASAMVESAMGHIRILEAMDFRQIVVSAKSTNVATTVLANRSLASMVEYPIHIGMTEAGTLLRGSITSAAGMAILLSEGIGDAVRVSLAASPLKEIQVGFEILRGLGLRQVGPTVICCPTCGRCEIDVPKIAAQVEKRVKGMKFPVTIAVMGCGVNGPGEAKEADVGVAGGKHEGLLFRRGLVIRKVREREIVDALIEQVRRLMRSTARDR